MKKRKPRPAKRRKPHSSRKQKIRPPKVDFEFTDLDLTAFGGASILARTARQFGLFELLDEAVSVKVRNRGASDAQTLWAIVASLARGFGSLSDLDALRADTTARVLLGLGQVPEARRAGEWLGKIGASDVKGLWRAAVRFAERVAPAIVAHELETRGHVPLFIDATGIEVDGELFERVRGDYNGNRGYWLHGTFLGDLWSAGQLQPGGGRVTLNWRRLLDWSGEMLAAGTPVWLLSVPDEYSPKVPIEKSPLRVAANAPGGIGGNPAIGVRWPWFTREHQYGHFEGDRHDSRFASPGHEHFRHRPPDRLGPQDGAQAPRARAALARLRSQAVKTAAD